MPVLRAIAWIAACVYATIPSFWLVIHPFADYWRHHSRWRYRALVPLWIGMWLLAGAITRPWRHVLLYDSPWSWLPAGVLVALGGMLYWKATRGFSHIHLSGRAELEPGRSQRLVTGGIRDRVRHPIYLGHFLELLAWSAGTGMVVLYALTLFAMITGSIMLHLEDAELEQRFGAPYRDYKARVPAFVPKFWLSGRIR